MPTNNVQLKRGTAAAFANVTTKDPNTIYFITDTNRIYVGDSEYSRPVLYSAEAPSETMPKGTLYIREITENSIIRQQLYYSNGSTWNPVSAEPGDILAEAITAGNDGDVIPNAATTTFEVPTITVDTKGRVSDVVERTIDLVNFMPKSGGTFSGDVTIGGDLTADSIKTDGIVNISSSDIIDDGSKWLNRTTINFIDNNVDADSGDLQITAEYAVDKGDSSNTHSRFDFIASSVNVNGDASVEGTTYFYGPISQYYSQGQSSDSLTRKSYVDNAIASAISASDAMVFKGTVGTSGTAASFSAINVSSATKGDTYKVITADTLPAASSFDSTTHDLTPGDLIVYMGESKFIYVPSGDEDVTSVKVAGSDDTVNVSTTAQTGTVVLGDVATKNVSTSTTLNGNGASNDNVPTELAVKTYVDDTVGALENTLGTAATTDATDYATAAQGTKADNAMPKSGGTFTGDVTVSGDLTADSIKTSGEITITPATQVDITTNNQKHDNSKITFVNTNKVNNAEDISIEASYTADVSSYAGHTRDTSTLKLKASNVSVEGNLTATKIHGLTFNNTYDNADSVYTIKPIEDTTDNDNNPRLEFRYGVEYPWRYTEIVLNSDYITLDGDVLLSKTPTNGSHAATKKYVDDAISAATLTWGTL